MAFVKFEPYTGRGEAFVKTMMVYSLFRVIVYTFILQIHHLRSVDHHRSDMPFLK